MNIKRSSRLYQMAFRKSKKEMTRGCDVFFFATAQAFSTFIVPVLWCLFIALLVGVTVFLFGLITEVLILQNIGIYDTITFDDAISAFVTGIVGSVGFLALAALFWFFCSKINIID